MRNEFNWMVMLSYGELLNELNRLGLQHIPMSLNRELKLTGTSIRRACKSRAGDVDSISFTPDTLDNR